MKKEILVNKKIILDDIRLYVFVGKRDHNFKDIKGLENLVSNFKNFLMTGRQHLQIASNFDFLKKEGKVDFDIPGHSEMKNLIIEKLNSLKEDRMNLSIKDMSDKNKVIFNQDNTQKLKVSNEDIKKVFKEKDDVKRNQLIDKLVDNEFSFFENELAILLRKINNTVERINNRSKKKDD